MYRITGRIEGVAPLLYSAATAADIRGIETGSGGGKKTVADRLAEAGARVHRDLATNQIMIPSWNFKKCLLEGCTRAKLKDGKSSLMPYLAATVFPEHDLLLGVQDVDFTLEVLGKRPPKTGGGCIIRYPAMNPGWAADFSLLVVDDRRDPAAIETVIREAGMLVGLGSWRPHHGRFIASNLQVSTA